MEATLTDEKVVFSLALMANLGAATVGSKEEIEVKLHDDFKEKLETFKPELGGWEVVWGPSIYQHSPLTIWADNVVYIAKHQSEPPRYVIAIAATNPYSAFDWLVEDTLIAKQVLWKYTPKQSELKLKPAIADGVQIALDIIRQEMRPSPLLPGNSTTIQEFLSTTLREFRDASPSVELRIDVAGHSLGGMMSQVVALWLSDTQPDWDPDWDKESRAKLYCLSSAGPTPGNKDLATYYAGSPLGSRTKRIFNKIDVVPNLWFVDNIAAIPSLYEPTIQADPIVREIAKLAIMASSEGNYTHITTDCLILDGKVRDFPIQSGTGTGISYIIKNSFIMFIEQMFYQHIEAYIDLMDLTIFKSLMDKFRQPPKTLGNQGVIIAFERIVKKLVLSRLSFKQ